MMSEQYVLMTDSACDLAPALLEQWDIRLNRMPFCLQTTAWPGRILSCR